MRFDRESRTAGPVIEQLLEATMALNGLRLEQLLTQQMQMLGGARFARNIASPLLQEIGARWMRGELTIAAEHLASNQLRRLLSSALISVPTQVGSPRVLVFTPEGERHEFGALIAAIVASGTGASVLYLGTDLPCDAVVEATRTVPTAALAMSVVTLQEGSQRRYLRLLREQVAPEVKIWIGGAAALQDESAEYMADLDDLEARLRVLGSAS
jgi:methanogenic corrinoid protein MtbC1